MKSCQQYPLKYFKYFKLSPYSVQNNLYSVLFGIKYQICKTNAISVRPTIATEPKERLTVREGEDVRFLCRVLEGHPEPRLVWRKKGGRMPSGPEC